MPPRLRRLSIKCVQAGVSPFPKNNIYCFQKGGIVLRKFLTEGCKCLFEALALLLILAILVSTLLFLSIVLNSFFESLYSARDIFQMLGFCVGIALLSLMSWFMARERLFHLGVALVAQFFLFIPGFLFLIALLSELLHGVAARSFDITHAVIMLVLLLMAFFPAFLFAHTIQDRRANH